MPDNERLEREINEILDKIEQFPPPETRRARARKRAVRRFGNAIAERQRAAARWLARISISQVMLVSFLMILGSFFFRRFSPLMMQWVLYAGVVLFVSAFAIMVFSRGRGSSSAQYWRGRPIDSRTEPLSSRVRRWWGSRRRTR